MPPTGKRKRALRRTQLPPERGFLPAYASPMPELASIQLSTGQGTDERRINLVGELRAGECVLFDPKTRTEVTVWFERGRLKLKLAGCHIEMGSRFGDRAAPEPVTTKYRTTVEQDTKMVGQVQAGLHQSNRGTMAPSGGISGQVSLSRAVSRRAVTSSTVQDSPQVVAELDFWDFELPARDRPRCMIARICGSRSTLP